MDPLVLTYVAYLLLALTVTAWVGGVLQRNGRVFLLDVFAGDEGLAGSVNRLLVVGFYLVNLGFVFVALRTTDDVTGLRSAVETLSVKVGTVVLVLGALHLANLVVLTKLRRRAQLTAQLAARDAAWAAAAQPTVWAGHPHAAVPNRVAPR